MADLATNYKVIFSLIAIVITFVAYVPYIHSILNGSVKPHVFSWIIWGITTCIAFLAQFYAKGGVGAIPVGISGVITIFVASLAFIKRGDLTIHRIDWIFFISAIMSLPVWYLTSDPMWAIIILTLVDMLGFGPTIRKAYSEPFQENIVFFALFLVRNVLVIIALENYSLTTVLFPASIVIACFFLIFLILVRRMNLVNTII
jgi:hypothetical protein